MIKSKKKFLSLMLCLVMALCFMTGVINVISASKIYAEEESFSWDATKQEYSNEEAVTSISFGEGAKVSGAFDKGTAASLVPKYFTKGTAVRSYTDNTLTLTASDDYEITKIVFTYGTSDTSSNTISVSKGSLSSGTWTGPAESVNEVVFSFGGQRHIQAITVTVQVIDVLNSISISGTPSVMNYKVGYSFNPNGLVVTGTYASGDTKDLTEEADWTITPETFEEETNSATVVVQAQVGETVSETFTVENINVRIPVAYEIDNWNTLFGTSYDGSITSGVNKDTDIFSATTEKFTMVINTGSSTNAYVKDNDFRMYKGYTMTITAPDGYDIINITGQKGSCGKDIELITADCGCLEITADKSSMEWTGRSEKVVLSASGTMGFGSMSIEVRQRTFYDVWIAGVQVDEFNKVDFFGNGNYEIVFDDENNVLTLNDATIIAQSGDDVSTDTIGESDDQCLLSQCGIVSTLDNLTIVVNGDSQIGKYVNYVEGTTVQDDYDFWYGIRSTGNLTFTGDGSLTVYDADDGIKGNNITFDEDFSGTLTVYDVSFPQDLPPCAIAAKLDVNIQNGTFNLTSYNSNGITSYLGNIIIKDATITINSKNSGIMASDGNVAIDDSLIEIKSTSSSSTGIYANYMGDYSAMKSSVRLTNSLIDINAEEGIYCANALMLTGSTELTIDSVDGINVNNINISSLFEGILNIKATNNAILALNELTIDDSQIVINADYEKGTTKEITIKNTEENDGFVTVRPMVIYDVKIGDVQINEKNKDDVLGDGKIVYTPKTESQSAVLTFLDDCEIEGITFFGDDVVMTSGEKAVVITLTKPLLFGNSDIEKPGHKYTIKGNSETNTLTIRPKQISEVNSFRPVGIRTNNTLVLSDNAILENSNATAFGGGMINVAKNAIFEMNGGLIQNSKVSSTSYDNTGVYLGRGGAIYVAVNGTFKMSGGEIKDCSATVAGGAIYSCGTVEITGGKITGCSVGGLLDNDVVKAKGGAIYLYQGSFKMIAGEISGNALGDVDDMRGAGVYAASGVSITLGGTAKIYNNEDGQENESNLFLYDNVVFDIDSTTAPAEGMNVGISIKNQLTEVKSVQIASNANEDDDKYFFVDNGEDNKESIVLSEGNLSVVKDTTVEFDSEYKWNNGNAIYYGDDYSVVDPTVLYNDTAVEVSDFTYTYYELVDDEYVEIDIEPEDLGSYKVVITVVDDYYTGSKEIEFEIIKKTVDFDPEYKWNNGEAVYYGDDYFEEEPIVLYNETPVDVSSFVYSYYKFNGSEYEGIDGKPEELGKYKVVISVEDDYYTGSTEVEFEITKRTVDFDSEYKWNNGNAITYGDEYSEINPTVYRDGVEVKDLDFTYTYYKSTTKLDAKPVNAGDYKVVIAVDDEYYAGEKEIIFKINKKDIEVVWKELEVTYDGKSHLSEISATYTTEDGETHTIDKTYYQIRNNKNIYSIDNTEYTGTASNNFDDAGKYSATLTTAGWKYLLNQFSSNYRIPTGDARTYTYTIAQAENSVSDLAIEGWTYGDTAKTPTATAVFGEIVYTYSKTVDGTYTDTVPTDAGTYYVKAEVIETDNFAGAFATKQFKIAQKEIVITWTDKEFTYNGKDHLSEISATYKTIDGETHTINSIYVKNNKGIVKLTVSASSLCDEFINAGTYTANVYAKDAKVEIGDNYCLPKNCKHTYVVNKADMEFGTNYLTPCVPYIPLSYDGNELELLMSGLTFDEKDDSEFGTFYFSLDGESWSTDLPTAIYPGEYNPLWYFVGDDNHNDVGSAEEPISQLYPVEIFKGEQDFAEVQMEDYTYGGTVSTPSLDIELLEDATITYYYSENNETENGIEWKNIKTNSLNVGIYYMYAVIGETENYNGYTTDAVEFEISKAELTVTFDDKTSVYGSNIVELTATYEGLASGDKASDLFTLTTDATKDSDVGEYCIWAEEGNGLKLRNYDITYVGSMGGFYGTYTITKATNVITDFTLDSWIYGETPNSPSAKAKFGTIEFAYSKLTPIDFSMTECPTEIGKYIVKAYVVGNDNYSSVMEEKEFTIFKADITNPVDENGEVIENPVFEIIASKNGIDPDAVLVVKIIELNNVEDFEASKQALKDEHKLANNEKIYAVYDAKLLINGVEVQPNGNITIKILVPESVKDKEFKLYHVHKDGEYYEVFDIDYSDIDLDGYITFETDKLSQFVFVSISDECIYHYILLGLLLLILITISVYSITKRNKLVFEILLVIMLVASLAIGMFATLTSYCLMCSTVMIVDIALASLGFMYVLTHQVETNK